MNAAATQASPQADRERQEGLAGEPRATADNAHTDRGDRQKIRTDRHRTDDENHIAVDYAVAGDHAATNIKTT